MTYRSPAIRLPLNRGVLQSRAIWIAFLVACSGVESSAEHWSQFRGARMDGVATSSHPTAWSEEENDAWGTRLKGEGCSCPIVWEDQLNLTEAVP